jgi:hypothetical protein
MTTSPVGLVATDGTIVPFSEITIDAIEASKDLGDLRKQIAELQQAIAGRDATIEAQRQQLSRLLIPDWDGLMDELKTAGFSRWLADAGDSQPDLLDEVARLYAAAKVGDRIGVITEYLAIATQYSPSPEQLEAWQAVLDNYQPYPIPANLLWFVQPGASTSP